MDSSGVDQWSRKGSMGVGGQCEGWGGQYVVSVGARAGRGVHHIG